MITSIFNLAQEIANRMAGLWESGKQLFEIVDIVFSSLKSAFDSAFSTVHPSGNALIPAPLIWVVLTSVVIFAIKIIIGSSNG